MHDRLSHFSLNWSLIEKINISWWHYQQLAFKISELVQDKLEVFVGVENLPFHLWGAQNLDFYDCSLYQNRLVQIVKLDKKETLETIKWCKIIYLFLLVMNKFNKLDLQNPIGLQHFTCYRNPPIEVFNWGDFKIFTSNYL